MRTTIEMKNEHRAALLELAARRGEKGFSHLVEEAIEAYLRSPAEEERKREAALSVIGSISEDEAEELRKRVRRIREFWR